MNEEIQEFWYQFCSKHNLDKDTAVEAWAFGATEEEADELATLVQQGIKTATTSAYELYTQDEKLPEVGDWSIILDGGGKPVCVIRDVCVEIIPYNLISQEHAYHEGEGDRSYSYWRKTHDEFFTWEYKKAGKNFDLQAPMVCEVFEKIQ